MRLIFVGDAKIGCALLRQSVSGYCLFQIRVEIFDSYDVAVRADDHFVWSGDIENHLFNCSTVPIFFPAHAMNIPHLLNLVSSGLRGHNRCGLDVIPEVVERCPYNHPVPFPYTDNAKLCINSHSFINNGRFTL